jgi:hypothetical protein
VAATTTAGLRWRRHGCGRRRLRGGR